MIIHLGHEIMYNNKDLLNKIDLLNIAIDKIGTNLKNIQYIDLRVPNRIFYK